MPTPLVYFFAAIQGFYLASMLVTLWLYTRPVDLVDVEDGKQDERLERPDIILLYPVLRELEATMRTSMLGFSRAEYPGGRRRVVAIPNSDDEETIESLRRIAQEYDFLEVLPIPPTSDPSWQPVWDAWDRNEKAYWWHHGKRAGIRELPAKKTRQMVYALYTMANEYPDALLSYIDADSVVPLDYFLEGAIGMRHFDVLQNTNVAGNAMESWATTMFTLDHMLWDGSLYQHMSANGKHPYYVLGKGLFFRVSDLLAYGGFHPWLTIEDPEVGMRLWTNGCKLGVIRDPLIEEVPNTFGKGITQRKRWIAGFFQTLASPLKDMGMTPMQRFRARLNLVPCGSLIMNPLGLSAGAAVIVIALLSPTRTVPMWLEILCLVSLATLIVISTIGQRAAFTQTPLIFDTTRERLIFMLRVNPVFAMAYWTWWSIPLAIGFWMYLTDGGLTWQRTEKVDANHNLIRAHDAALLGAAPGAVLSSAVAAPESVAATPVPEQVSVLEPEQAFEPERAPEPEQVLEAEQVSVFGPELPDWVLDLRQRADPDDMHLLTALGNAIRREGPGDLSPTEAF